MLPEKAINYRIFKDLNRNAYFLVKKEHITRVELSPEEISVQIGLSQSIKTGSGVSPTLKYQFDQVVIRGRDVFINPFSSNLEIAKYSYVTNQSDFSKLMGFYEQYLKQMAENDGGFLNNYPFDRTRVNLLDKGTKPSNVLAEILTGEI